MHLELVSVHGEAHRAARHAPIETRLHQHLVEALLLRLLLHHPRAWDDHRLHMRRHLTTLGNRCDSTDVLDATVGARADEDLVDADRVERCTHPVCEAHVLQSTLHAGTPRRVGARRGIRHDTSDRCGVLRRGAPSDGGGDVRGVDVHLFVVDCTLIRSEGLPMSHGSRPVGAVLARKHGAAPEVFDRLIVRGNQACACPRLDGHVAHAHTSLHGERADGRASELDGCPGAAGGADYAADVKYNVLGGDTGAELALDGDAHVERLDLRKRRRGEHVLDFRRADAKGERAESAVSCRV
mmetsp:Transcript_80846/g.160658  ORF Transcript_80846/g.160658 Transcript_80846/m.160658 type:complete len:297 (-) Transcript_80846:505-1395(-)